VKSLADWLKERHCDRDIGAPWFFRHASGNISLEAYMDDLFGTGPERNVVSFLTDLSGPNTMKWEIHRVGDTFIHLKRQRTLYATSVFISANPRYVNDMQTILGLEGCKGASTPCVKPVGLAAIDNDEIELFELAHAHVFRRGTSISIYICIDREVGYAFRELTVDLKTPTHQSMTALVRIACYLIGTKNYDIFIPVEGKIEELLVYSDTNREGDSNNRNSVACGDIVTGGSSLYLCVRGQGSWALSSAEAEFVGGVIAACEGIFIKGRFEFFGYNVTLTILMDSSAARAIFRMKGCGCIRHLETKFLWVQAVLADGVFKLDTVAGTDNKSDIGTKALDCVTFEKHRKALGIMTKKDAEQKTGGAVIGLGTLAVIAGGTDNLRAVLPILLGLAVATPTQSTLVDLHQEQQCTLALPCEQPHFSFQAGIACEIFISFTIVMVINKLAEWSRGLCAATRRTGGSSLAERDKDNDYTIPGHLQTRTFSSAVSTTRRLQTWSMAAAMIEP
jgi:hypothetical protein